MSLNGNTIIPNGLVCHLDAIKYSGTGATWSDLSNNGYNATNVGSAHYTHSSKSSVTFVSNAGVTYNYSMSPDGAKNAIRVSNTPSLNSYFTFHNGGPQTVSGLPYTVSFYGKSDGSNSVLFFESFYNDYFNVNLMTQTISLGINATSSSVTNVGNGWYRYSVTCNPTSAHIMTNVVYVGAYGSTATQSYAQVYGFHVEYGSSFPFTPSFMFNGSTQYFTASTIPDSLWNSSSWTVSTWVNFATVNRGFDNAIVGHGSTVINGGLHIGERAGKSYLGFYGYDIAGGINLSANAWYNLTFTFDSSTLLRQIFVNGAFDTSGGTTAYSGIGTNTVFGMYQYNTVNKMFGTIASISIYNRVLSASEILQNYNNSKGRYLL